MNTQKTTTALLPFGIQPESAWRVSVDLTPELANQLQLRVYLVSKFWSENSMVESVRFDLTEAEREGLVALAAADDRTAMSYEDRIGGIDAPIIHAASADLPFVRRLGDNNQIYLAWSISRHNVALDYMNHTEEMAIYTTNPIPWSLLEAVKRGLDVPPGPWHD